MDEVSDPEGLLRTRGFSEPAVKTRREVIELMAEHDVGEVENRE